MVEDKCRVSISENYRDYKPPFDVKKLISVLLTDISGDYLIGLNEVVLTNTGTFNRSYRRYKLLSRKKKVVYSECLGTYGGRRRSKNGTITLFVDNIIEQLPKWTYVIPFIKNLVFSDVLFHELGHHIHATRAPEHNEREDVADRWSNRLKREFMRKHYWYLKPFVLFLKPIVMALAPAFRKMERTARGGRI